MTESTWKSVYGGREARVVDEGRWKWALSAFTRHSGVNYRDEAERPGVSKLTISY